MTHWKDYWDEHAERGDSDALVQVQRVLHGQPIDADRFALVADHIVDQLELAPSHRVLDLCCGNGLLTAEIEPRSASVVAVDFCHRLVREVPKRTSEKTVAISVDVLEVDFPSATFDRVLLAAALQHFSEEEVIQLFQKAARVLRPGGIFLITDIPDSSRMWKFFDSAERENAHFRGREDGTPVLGTWFDPGWLERLGRYVGFSVAEALGQPADFPYAHYRVDLRCRN